MSAPILVSQNGDRGCFTDTAEPFGLSFEDHDISVLVGSTGRVFDALLVVSVEASTLSWLQSSSSPLISTSLGSAAGGAAASTAGVSGLSPEGTACAWAGSTDAAPKPAARTS